MPVPDCVQCRYCFLEIVINPYRFSFVAGVETNRKKPITNSARATGRLKSSPMIPEAIPPAHSTTPATRRAFRRLDTGSRCTIFPLATAHLRCSKRLLPHAIIHLVTGECTRVPKFGTPSRCMATIALDHHAVYGVPAPTFICTITGG